MEGMMWPGTDSVLVPGYFGLIPTLDAGEDSWILMQTLSTPFSVLCLPLKLLQLQDLLTVPCRPPWPFWNSYAIVWAHHQLLWPSGWVCTVAEDHSSTALIQQAVNLPRLVSMAGSTSNPICITETKHFLSLLLNTKGQMRHSGYAKITVTSHQGASPKIQPYSTSRYFPSKWNNWMLSKTHLTNLPSTDGHWEFRAHPIF